MVWDSSEQQDRQPDLGAALAAVDLDCSHAHRGRLLSRRAAIRGADDHESVANLRTDVANGLRKHTVWV